MDYNFEAEMEERMNAMTAWRTAYAEGRTVPEYSQECATRVINTRSAYIENRIDVIRGFASNGVKAASVDELDNYMFDYVMNDIEAGRLDIDYDAFELQEGDYDEIENYARREGVLADGLGDSID